MDDHDSGNGQGCKHPRQDAGERKMEGKKGQVKGMDMVEQHSSTGKQHASGQDRSGPRTDRSAADCGEYPVIWGVAVAPSPTMSMLAC